MELKPEDVLSMQHKGWLDHPVTKQLLQVLEKQKQHYIERSVTGLAQDDQTVIRSMVAYRTTQTTITAVTNTEHFLKLLTN